MIPVVFARGRDSGKGAVRPLVRKTELFCKLAVLPPHMFTLRLTSRLRLERVDVHGEGDLAGKGPIADDARPCAGNRDTQTERSLGLVLRHGKESIHALAVERREIHAIAVERLARKLFVQSHLRIKRNLPLKTRLLGCPIGIEVLWTRLALADPVHIVADSPDAGVRAGIDAETQEPLLVHLALHRERIAL